MWHLLKLYFLYFVIIFIVSSIQNRNPLIGLFSIVAVWKQFFGYGFGFLKSFFKINILRKKPQDAFPELFFKINSNPMEAEKELIFEKQMETPIQKSVEKVIDKIFTPINKIVEPVVTKSKIIGLTGGIGSGKTTVAKYLISKGIPVYISDVEAKKVMEEAVPMGSLNEVHQYARTLLNMNQTQEAFKVFKANYDKHPNVLTTNVGLGRAYSAMGDYKKALEYMKAALPQAAEGLEKNNVENLIKKLEEGKNAN